MEPQKKWEEVQKWETSWWGDCLNTYGEEEKQLVYAKKMGLRLFHNGKSPYNIDLNGNSVADIGGGVASLILKTVNRPVGCVVYDPILKGCPAWVTNRYVSGNIIPLAVKGENVPDTKMFDEVWIYNVLQHTEDPELVIKNARKISGIVRLFEWIGIKDDHGHPHELTEPDLNKWLGGEGKTEMFNHYTLKGMGYYGVFKGDNYRDNN